MVKVQGYSKTIFVLAAPEVKEYSGLKEEFEMRNKGWYMIAFHFLMNWIF